MDRSLSVAPQAERRRSSKTQIPNKSQIPNETKRAVQMFGDWNFLGRWNLGFGTSNFVGVVQRTVRKSGKQNKSVDSLLRFQLNKQCSTLRTAREKAAPRFAVAASLCRGAPCDSTPKAFASGRFNLA
jgi:hypothetical protein